MNSFALMAIPFFIYAGELMQHGASPTGLVRLANAIIGHIRGGLGLVNVLASMLFGGISGSAVADASALGTTLIPMMREKGFDDDYSVNVTVTLGHHRPDRAAQPQHDHLLHRRRGHGFRFGSVHGRYRSGRALRALPDARGLCYCRQTQLPARKISRHALAAVHLCHSAARSADRSHHRGRVLSGIFTATESSAIAVIYAVLVTVLAYRSMSLKDFCRATVNAVRTTAMVLLIIGTAASFAWLLALNQVPARLFELLKSISDNPYVIILMINAILLFLGTFMDMSPLIIICTPIFLPVVKNLGMDPVQFGIILMINLGIGLVTPPVGSVLFVGCAVGKVRIEDTVKTIWPFYGAMVLALLLVTYLKPISMFLPELLLQ